MLVIGGNNFASLQYRHCIKASMLSFVGMADQHSDAGYLVTEFL